jgi:NADH-quinone oxidoreductase subunit I
MGHIDDTLRALWTTLRTAFRPTSTVEFPAVVRPRGDRYRVSFALPDDENGEMACIGCLTCERICPSQVIKVKPGAKRESPVTGKKRAYTDGFVIDLGACIQCELCVQVCNNDAIVMVREAERPTFEREDLVLGIERLRKNATDRTLSWGRGTMLQESQEPAKVEKKAPVAKPEPAPAEPPKEPT